MISHTSFRRRLLVTALLAASAGQSHAQLPPMLEEVLVTAQKRAQSLQDVPISIVAYDSDKLAALGIDELTDISASIPSLVVNSFNNDPGAVRLFLRGIGQNDVQLTQDPSVALYLDGVYIGSSFGSGFEGVDIERLEVLRGPQGTLYGRNATGGAINIITRRASVEATEFRQDFTIGNLGAFKSRTLFNVPLSDSLAAKVNYLISRRDGYVQNDGIGSDYGEEDRSSAVVDLRWQASDEITVDYRFEQAEMEDSQRFEQITRLNPSGQLAGFTTITETSPDRLNSATSLREIKNNDLEITAHTVQVDWLVNDTLTLKSISAQREFDNQSYSDPLSTAEGNGIFYSGAPSLGNYKTDFEQLSQEFQLIGNSENLVYVTGLYYYQDKANSMGVDNISLGGPRQLDTTSTENASLAVFGEATYTPNLMQERWHLTLGARYSKDNRKAQRNNFNISPEIDNGQYDKDFSNFNPALTISFDLNDDMNVYGKVVSGFKSGGTSQRSANAALFAQGFDEEEILSYEAGFKGDFWDQRARLNAALFSMDIDGYQTSVQTGSTPGARDFLPMDDNSIEGVEMDLSILITEELTFTAGYSHLNTELGVDSIDSPAGTFTFADSFSYAPENSYNLGIEYFTALSNGNLTASVNYSYQDEFLSSVNEEIEYTHDDHGLWGAAIAWSDIKLAQLDGNFKVLLWGKNLDDEEYTVSGGGSWAVFGAGDVLTFGDPRTYGVTLSYSYE